MLKFRGLTYTIFESKIIIYQAIYSIEYTWYWKFPLLLMNRPAIGFPGKDCRNQGHYSTSREHNEGRFEVT